MPSSLADVRRQMQDIQRTLIAGNMSTDNHSGIKRTYMDTLEIEPRASRMLSGCDTTTPCARLRSGKTANCMFAKTKVDFRKSAAYLHWRRIRSYTGQCPNGEVQNVHVQDVAGGRGHFWPW